MPTLDEYLTDSLHGPGAIKTIVKLFCRNKGKISIVGDENIPMTMVVGIAYGPIMQPGADEDQLIHAEMVLTPRGIWTASSHDKSPGKGMRADQILTRPETLTPKYWDKQLR